VARPLYHRNTGQVAGVYRTGFRRNGSDRAMSNNNKSSSSEQQQLQQHKELLRSHQLHLSPGVKMSSSTTISTSPKFTLLSTHHLSTQSPSKEITLQNLIDDSEAMAEEAKEVLPYSFDECTYDRGYLRQAIWSCIGMCSVLHSLCFYRSDHR
jgi:hypothetical protein